jgi:hypothetical protein
VVGIGGILGLEFGVPGTRPGAWKLILAFLHALILHSFCIVFGLGFPNIV